MRFLQSARPKLQPQAHQNSRKSAFYYVRFLGEYRGKGPQPKLSLSYLPGVLSSQSIDRANLWGGGLYKRTGLWQASRLVRHVCLTIPLLAPHGPPTPNTFSKVLPYKWEAYCRTNRIRIAVRDFQPHVETRWLVTGALVPSQGLPKGCLRGAATNLRLKQALNGSPIVIVQCVPTLDMKMLLRYVPRPPTLTYVLLTCVLEMPDAAQMEGVLWGCGPPYKLEVYCTAF